MPLWLVLTLAFVVIAASSAAAMGYFTTAVLSGVLSGSAYDFASISVFAIDAAFMVALAILFLVLGRVIAGPVRNLAKAITAYAKRGERIPVVIPSYAPKEVQELVRSFVELIGSVEASHKRDVDVSKVKSDFISTAAHQLRTPLTAIRWALEALEKSDLSEDQKALVTSASDKGRELVAIVGTLLDISAIESGKYKYAFAPTDVQAILAELTHDLAPLAALRGVAFSYTPAASVPPVRADGERIKWVITNLVENAIRYTPKGGQVSVSASAAANRVFVRVRDTGIGISAEDRGNIFERFFRGGNAIAKENEGNGLGLYIARTIATDHGGDLNFESNKEGVGTTFTLSLPVGGPAA